MGEIKCSICNGHYVLRDGKFGVFAGCSNYPRCKSTMKIYEIVLDFIYTYGIGIYRWDKICWKCEKSTPVYSYYLDYELADFDVYFNSGLPSVGLGDISYVDKLLMQKFQTIQERFSKTTKSYNIANTCAHCGALQGRNYVVEDPHEIIDALWHDRGMGEFLLETLHFPDTKFLLSDIKRIYTICN